MSGAESVTATFSYVPAQTQTTTAVSCTPNPSQYEQPVICTATVTGQSGTPTGNVTFYNGTTALGNGIAERGLSVILHNYPAGWQQFNYRDLQRRLEKPKQHFFSVHPDSHYDSNGRDLLEPVLITFGTGIPAANCTVTPNIPGTYTYNPGLGIDLRERYPTTITITFTPTDTTHYAPSTTTASLTINKATPVITWGTPKPITYGTALSGTQLNAYASGTLGTVYGTYVYSPAAGAVLSAGSQTLSVTFTPTDTNNYNKGATGSTTLIVNQAMPTITWVPPTSSITYGTGLSAVLDAAVNPAIAGTWAYTASGTPVTASTVLTAGSYTLVANFTPADTTDYTAPAPVSIPLTVNQATPVITWAAPTPITYGTNLSGVLDATDTLGNYVARSKTRANPHVKRNDGDGTFAYTLTTVNESRWMEPRC